MKKNDLTQLIKAEAAACGFGAVGIAEAVDLNDEAVRLQNWLDRGYHGGMDYLNNYLEIRKDAGLLLEGARSVISLAFNYYNPDFPPRQSRFKISRYAAGRDYHKVLKGKLKRMVRSLEEKVGPFQSRICVDSAPIMERPWGVRSGLGWIGKNGNLIIPGKGSFYFLAELIVDIELEYDRPAVDHCGHCRRCIDACPTTAIVEPYVVDSRKCISYLTIEHKGEFDAEVAGSYNEWIFGCDICQDVCPFNRFSERHDEKDFVPKEDLACLTEDDWKNLTSEQYDKLFGGSAVKRTGFVGLKRNIKFLTC